MNTVCPGFMPHHVKPNRCRRCFRDIHDHDSNKDVTSTFTISLPRRRRESVAIAEADESRNQRISSYSVSISDSSSLGRRNRQRSSSTSSWFQEKKESEAQREKSDSLYRNIDDLSIPSHTEMVNHNDDDVKTFRHRWRASDKANDNSDSSSIRLKSKDESTDKYDYTRRRNDTTNGDYSRTNDKDGSISSSRYSRKAETESASKYSSARDDKKTEITSSSPSKPWEIKLKSAKASAVDTSNSLKTTDSKKADTSEFSKSSSSRFTDSRWKDQQTTDSKYGRDNSSERPKPTEARRDSKVSIFASRFETPTTRAEKPSVTKPPEVKPKEIAPKSVLSRFAPIKKEEPPVPVKPKVVAKVNAPPSSSEESSSEESSEESNHAPPPPATTSRTVPKPAALTRTGSKESEPSSPEVAFVVKLKPSPTPSLSRDDKVKDQKKPDEKVSELQSELEKLKKDFHKTEELCEKLGREKIDIEKKHQLLLDKDKEALEKTASELTKMRSKLNDLQSAQDLVKDENKKLKSDSEKYRKELDKSKLELDRNKQDSRKVNTEFDRTKYDLEKLKKEMDRSKLEVDRSKKDAERSKKDLEKSKEESAKYQKEVDEFKQQLEQFKQELDKSQKDLEKSKEDLDESNSELAKSKIDLENSNRDLESARKDSRSFRERSHHLVRDTDDESKKLKQELEKTRKELETSKSEIEKAKRESEKSKTEIEKVKKEADKFKLEVGNSKKDLDSSNKELDKSKKEFDKFKTESDKVKRDLDKTKLDWDKTKRDLDKTKQDLEKTKQDWDKTKQDLEKTKQDWDKTKHDLEKTKQDSKAKESPTQSESKSKSNEQLKQKLQQTETLCQELMEENEEIKKEVRDLEQELEELHDNFREDQASEFRGLKKELETATKNCRVLQFKLRKTEKRCDQLEMERHSLEDKVREFQATPRTDSDKGRTKELENEIKMSRKLTAALNEEIDTLKDSIDRLQVENDALKVQKGTPRSITPTKQSRLSPVASRDGRTTPLGKDVESISRELYDTMERENDLREQLKFSEEEAKSSRRKMSALEQENETLMMQMKKLNTLLRARKDTGKNKLQDEEEEEDLSADNLKLQLEMQEQEMAVVRRKLEDTEKENENLQSEVKYLQEKIINQPLIQLPDLPDEPTSTSSSAGSVYWEKKARLLEHELRETRKKTMEKEREIERLNTEVEIYRKKASRMMVRSRSLDSDLQVDLKRQLQLVEQEASILRQKVTSLESENDRLNSSNKRLNLRVSKKPPMSSAEIAQLDNLELQMKNDELMRKLESLKEELVEKSGKDDNPVAVLQDYKPRRESLTSVTDNETDFIASLKKKIKIQEEEQQSLQNKCMHLEIDHNRLTREHRRLKEALASKKRPMKAIRDSATRMELKELVDELQDEISELQVSLRGREVVQEDLEEELERMRRSLREAIESTKKKEDQLKEDMRKEQIEKEAIQKEADAQKKRASNAEEQLSQVSGQLGSDQIELSKKARSLQEQLQESQRKCKAAEEALEKKTRRLRETQEKLNAVTSLKDDLVRTNRLLQSQKDDLAKGLDDHKDLLSKAESRISDLRCQMDNTDHDVISLRKECNQLRNELEDERSRLQQMKPAGHIESSGQYTKLAKEKEDLRRANNELRNKTENLQQQISQNAQIYIEKESRLREDHQKKKENAVREAREKGEKTLELMKAEEKIIRGKLQETSDKMEKIEVSLRESQEKSRQLITQHRREKEEWQSSMEDLESRHRAETKKRERAERDTEQANKSKQEELLQSKDRLVQVEREQRRLLMQVQEAENDKQKMAILEKDVDKMRKEYDDLTSKYDQLEADFVRTKCRLVQEKELAETEIQCLKRDTNDMKAELVTMKDTHTTKQDSWVKEKLHFQDRVKEADARIERLKSTEQERIRLRNQLDEKETLVDSYRKEEKHLKEEREKLRRTVDEMSKASEAQRLVWITSIGSSSADAAKGATRELVSLKAEYEGRMTIMNSEITSMQKQIASLAGERDSLKARLSSAERNAEEMKTGSLKRERTRHREEADLARRKVRELRHQMEEMKEQMDDNLLENKNLRLQIETDKNSYDIEIAELKSKINQLEEQKILENTRGQTRNIAKTRLELAWEKERGDLQHLLTESQKLVTDLKSRLQEADKDKDTEKQGLRRQLVGAKEAAEKDHLENRRKMSELHSSLLDMRESQAKLRGLYDKMKREREILLSERDEWRQRLHLAQQLHTKITELNNDVELVSSTIDQGAAKPAVTQEIKDALTKVKEKFSELQKSSATLKMDDNVRRTMSFRRAVSAQEVNLPNQKDPLQRWNQPQRITNYPVAPPSMILRPPPRQKALHRKSLSLDHTLGQSMADNLKIWESGGESVGSTPAGSLLSLRMGYGYESDSSFPDSEYKYGGSLQEHRMSRRYLQTPGGMTTDGEMPSSREGSIATSCESVPVAVHHQKKSTLKDKLKLLRRAKSIDVSSPVSGDGSTTKQEKQESLRSKISKVLKKPLGRSISMDVHHKSGPALPPKGLAPDSAPKRPTAEKPLSASRGELSTERPLKKSMPSTPSRTGRETPV